MPQNATKNQYMHQRYGILINEKAVCGRECSRQQHTEKNNNVQMMHIKLAFYAMQSNYSY